MCLKSHSPDLVELEFKRSVTPESGPNHHRGARCPPSIMALSSSPLGGSRCAGAPQGPEDAPPTLEPHQEKL